MMGALAADPRYNGRAVATHQEFSTKKQKCRWCSAVTSQTDAERSKKAFETNPDAFPGVGSRCWVDELGCIAIPLHKSHASRVPFLGCRVAGHAFPVCFRQVKLNPPDVVGGKQKRRVLKKLSGLFSFAEDCINLGLRIILHGSATACSLVCNRGGQRLQTSVAIETVLSPKPAAS